MPSEKQDPVLAREANSRSIEKKTKIEKESCCCAERRGSPAGKSQLRKGLQQKKRGTRDQDHRDGEGGAGGKARAVDSPQSKNERISCESHRKRRRTGQRFRDHSRERMPVQVKEQEDRQRENRREGGGEFAVSSADWRFGGRQIVSGHVRRSPGKVSGN